MANVIYNEYKTGMVMGTVAFTNGTTEYGVLLVDSTYTPLETDTVTTVLAKEVLIGTFADYARQDLAGVLVTTETVSATSTDDFIKVIADNTSFGDPVTLTAAGAVIFKKDTNLNNNPLTILCYTDFSGDKSSSNGEFTIVWNTNGIFNYKQSV